MSVWSRILLLVLLVFSVTATVTSKSESEETYNFDENLKNVCYDGQDPSKWDMKTRLSKFAQGPCSPMVIVPGISGSKLNIEIDCKKLKNGDPSAFKTCGWTGCKWYNRRPKSEYRVWIPSPYSKVSIITPFKRSKRCWTALVESDYAFGKDGDMVYKPKPGVSIKPVGATHKSNTLKTGNCAFDGVENLLKDVPQFIQRPGLKKLRVMLEHMGYQNGLTFQALPYDWRLESGMDDLSKGFKNLLRDMKKITNKKVTILGHSMGNFRTVNMLWNTSQQERDELVRNWIAVGPPFIGSSVGMLMLTCGSEDFKFALGLGLDVKTYQKSVGTFASILQLLPYQTYESQTETSWMKKIFQRIAYENGQQSNPVFPWLPPRGAQCFPDFPQSPQCLSGLADLDNFGQDVTGQAINNDNLLSFLEKNSFFKDIRKAWVNRDVRHETLPNVGVPLTLVYNTRFPTLSKMDFKVNPKTWTAQNDQYCTVESGGFDASVVEGDGVVPSTSSVTLGMKMAIDYEDGVQGAKPVKFVDFCSTYNQGKSAFDTTDPSGAKLMSQNGYIGIKCECTEGNYQGTSCDHSRMLNSDPLLDFLSNTLVTGDRTQITQEYSQLNKSFFDNWVQKCQLFNRNVAGPHVNSENVSVEME